MAGLTLDSGALIAFDRHDRGVMAQLKAARLSELDVTVPAIVVAEVWRGGPRSARIAMLLATCVIDELDETLAKSAGAALAATPGGETCDAVVMASADNRRDPVLTCDVGDLSKFSRHFPAVKLIRL